MLSEQEIVLKPRKSRFFIFLVVAGFLLWLSAYLIFVERQDGSWFGGLVALFMASAIVWFLFKINPFKPSIIINSIGILAAYKKGSKIIPWTEIRQIEKFTQIIPQLSKTAFIPLKQAYLVIYTEPKDSTYYDEGYGGSRMENIMKRLDKNLYVPSSMLPYKVDRVVTLLNAYKNKTMTTKS
jgi:hypothetical protein